MGSGGAEPRRSTGRAAFVVAMAVAALVGVAIGGAVFSSSKSGGSGTSGSRSGSSSQTSGGGADTAPITLPSRLGSYRDAIEAFRAHAGLATATGSQQRNQAAIKAETEAAYTKAYGGAAAAYQGYASADLTQLPYVIAVRGHTPGLTLGPVVSAAYLGLAKPEHDVVNVGDVQCLVAWSPTPAGQTPPPWSEVVSMCQRTGPKLTVFAGGSGFTGPSGLQALVSLTDGAWSATVGG